MDVLARMGSGKTREMKERYYRIRQSKSQNNNCKGSISWATEKGHNSTIIPDPGSWKSRHLSFVLFTGLDMFRAKAATPSGCGPVGFHILHQGYSTDISVLPRLSSDCRHRRLRLVNGRSVLQTWCGIACRVWNIVPGK